MIIPTKLVDFASLAAQAEFVVSAGGTIARESAFQGTCSIVISTIGRFHVNDYLERKGFPIFTFSDMQQALKCARKNLGRKWNVKNLLEKLENPIDVIEKIVSTT